MLNHSSRARVSPTLVPIVQHDTNPQSFKLQGIIVNAEGTLKVRDAQGNEFTFTFTEFDATGPGAYSIFPSRLDIEVTHVLNTGTTIADGDMIGLRY